MNNRIAIIGQGVSAATLALLLSTMPGAQVVLPERRRDLEPGFDFNDTLDLDRKRRKRAERQAHLKAAGSRAFGGAV